MDLLACVSSFFFWISKVQKSLEDIEDIEERYATYVGIFNFNRLASNISTLFYMLHTRCTRVLPWYLINSSTYVDNKQKKF